MKKYFLLNLLCIVFSLNGQTFKNLNIKDGLPSSIIYDLKLDKQNRIWIATFGGGISVYDGNSFKTINQDNGLNTDLIRCLYVDTIENSIYVGAQGALDLIKKDTIINLSKVYKDSVSPNVVYLNKFNKNELIVSNHNGVFIYKNNQAIPVLEYVNVSSVYLDKNLNYWLAGRKHLIVKTKTGSKLFLKKPDSTNIEGCSDIKMFGDNVIVSAKNELYIFNNLKLVNVVKNLQQIKCMLVCNNQLWIGTVKGLYITEDFKTFKKLDKQNGIPEYEIKCLIKDKNNMVWVGTTTNGIYKQLNTNIEITNSQAKIHAFCNYNNQLYGITNTHVVKFNEDSNKFLPIHKLDKSLNFSVTFQNDIAIDNNNTFYIVASELGFIKITNGKQIHITHKLEKEDNPAIGIFIKDSLIYFGFKRSILVHNTKNNKTDTLLEILSNGKFFQKFISKNNTIWITYDKGLMTISPDYKIKTYTKNNIQDFPNGMMNKIISDKYNNLWLASDRGLSVFSNNKIYNKFRKNGFPTNEISDIQLIDSLLYVATNKGLIEVQINKSNENLNEFKIIDDQYGLPDYNLTDKTIYSFNKKIWISDENSIIKFIPTKIKEFNAILYITDITQNGLSFINNNNKNYTKQYVNTNTELVLTFNQNDFEINFIYINQHNLSKLNYSYRLQGLKNDWSIPSENNKAVFTNLDAGNYIFELKLLKNKNQIGEILKYKIKILPPFYKTWWFYLSITIVLLILIYAFIKWRLYNIEQKNKLLSYAVNIRTEELKKKSIELENSNLELNNKNKLITDSLDYATKIQENILPDNDQINSLKPIKFEVIYFPKDKVSGDFYYVYTLNKYKIISVIDCTGHGVPGALLTFAVYSILQNIIKSLNKFISCEEILNKLLLEFNLLYKKNKQSAESYAISLLILDTENNLAHFNSVSQSIFHVSDNIGNEIKSSTSFLNDEKSAKDTIINFKKGDRFYLYSDGYFDQKSELTKKRLYKSELFKQINNSLNLSLLDQKMFLSNYFNDYKGNLEQLDDVTFILLEIGY